MSKLKEVRRTLISAVIACIAIRVIWWSIAPLLSAAMPYLILGICLISMLGFALYRTTKL